MTPITRLMVSHPDSGFGIYLPNDARDHLGGYNAAVVVLFHEQENDTILFKIFPKKDGKHFIRRNGKGSRDARIFWGKLGKHAPPIPYHFGKQDIVWQYEGNGISFVFPRKSELKDPHTKRPPEPKKGLLGIGSH